MSDAIHLLIPFAMATGPGCAQAVRDLRLPELRKLLARLDEGALDAGATSLLSLPHERALARAIGLPAGDGLVPWAAWERQLAHQDAGTMPWAWLTPCHWEVGMDHVRMHAPAHLRLSPDHSRAMFDAMRPYFEEDGIALTWEAPDRWLAQGEVFLDLPCASLDRVVGRLVDDWLPRRSATGTLQRLQQEMQMLLYTHPANAEREQAGLKPVNSFWVSGAGALPDPPPTRLPPGLKVEERLRQCALDGDWTAWAAVWRQVDAQELPRLLAALDQGRPVTLTLCGERSARSWVHSHSGWWRRAASLLRAPSVANALEAL